MKRIIRKSKYDFVMYFVCASLVLFIFSLAFSKNMINTSDWNVNSVSASTDTVKKSVTVILDAGHGGEDAGAVSEDGILEKELNLLMCEQIRDILKVHNIDVVLTREEDKLLYTEQQNIKGQRKIYDLKNRYLIASEYENAVFVSVHMNKFPESQYKGLQVYYSPNDECSKELAYSIQSSVVSQLQTDKNRKIKKATSSIYLLDRLKCPAVLVECGFLSNADDCKNLTDEEYRTKLCWLICSAIIENIS